MESFVPLGGFFSMPPETKSPLSNACQYVARCHLCNDKYKQEVAAVSNGASSPAEKHQSSSIKVCYYDKTCRILEKQIGYLKDCVCCVT